VFKAADGAVIGRLGVTTPVVVIDPWLEVPDEAEQDTPRTAGEVLFTGAMWRRENDEGVRWLLERVWPQVRQAVPGARLVVAGSGPSHALLRAAEAAGGVSVTGEVPDLGVHYRRASVFVAPLLVGGGLKFKVPQAMAHALPVVATSIAAEGVEEAAPAGALWAVSDDPAVLADRLVEALRDPVAAAACGRRAAGWARHRFAAAATTDALLDRYAELVADRR
jgi:glycosyltransferase involved in cell wall biosynthesis